MTVVLVAVVALSLRPAGTEPAWLLILGRAVPMTLLAAGIVLWCLRAKGGKRRGYLRRAFGWRASHGVR